jgi:subtilisin family serine protease
MQPRTAALICLSLVVAGCSADRPLSPSTQDDLAPIYMAAAGNAVSANRFIVVLRDGASDAAMTASSTRITRLYTYSDVFKGFAADLTPEQVLTLRRNRDVKFLEQDQRVSVTTTQTIPADGVWGLDRIDQRGRGLSGSYTYTALGTGVTAYVIDTGLLPAHDEFQTLTGSRASNVFDAFGGNGKDCNGHGTHVAGTIGGVNTGVAKMVKLRGLRTLNCDGSGTSSGSIKAMDWIRKNGQKPAVVNMSLGGGFSAAGNKSVDALTKAGFFVVVSAGNDAAYSCNVSPASAITAFTVAAMDSSDARASFSNWGRCIQMYAPGVGILSAIFNDEHPTEMNWYTKMSGTSQAGPHVAGVVALYLQTNPTATVAQITTWLLSNATLEAVRGNTSSAMYGTPNRMLFKGTL